MRRGWLLGLVGAAIVALSAPAPVLAVHDLDFQLEGNVEAGDLDYTDIDDVGPGQPVLTDGTLTGVFAGAFDWDSLFEPDTDEIDQSANGFVDQDFVVDYKTTTSNKGPVFDPAAPTTF